MWTKFLGDLAAGGLTAVGAVGRVGLVGSAGAVIAANSLYAFSGGDLTRPAARDRKNTSIPVLSQVAPPGYYASRSSYGGYGGGK